MPGHRKTQTGRTVTLPQLERRRVYDVFQRILHWWIAIATILLSFTGLVASEMEPGAGRSYLFSLHMDAGQVFAAGLVLRIFWGFFGPVHARWKSFWHLREWREALRNPLAIPSADGPWGHHSHAALSYIALYFVALAMGATGVALSSILHGEGPLGERLLDVFTFEQLFRTVHEFGFWGVVFFVVTHVGAIIFHEYKDRIPIAQSMISGFQYRSTGSGRK